MILGTVEFDGLIYDLVYDLAESGLLENTLNMFFQSLPLIGVEKLRPV